MKTEYRNSRPEHGSVLIISLIICGVLGILMAGYLVMVNNQHFSVSRAAAWNSAIALAEAGVEEAMSHLNDTNTIKLGYAPVNKWDNVAAQTYWKSNFLATGSYDVAIITTNALHPMIVSTGYIRGPLSSPRISRVVQVRAKQISLDLVSGAMVVQDTADLKGFNITTDSFNSTNDLYSSNGLYDPAKARDLGDITTISSKTNAMSIGNAKIKGSVHTGVHGKVDLGAAGAVGTKAFVEGGSTGIETGHSKQDAPSSFPDATLTGTGWLPVSPGNYNINGTTYKYLLAGNNKNYSVVNLDGSTYVSGSGVKLRVTGSVNLGGGGNNQDEIRIPAGKSLAMYVSAPSASIMGNGVVNDTGQARSFQYYGLPSNTTLTVGGNGGFIGQIYAPEAKLTLGGGGNTSVQDFTGCSVTFSVKLNGHFNFHFDEASNSTLNIFGYTAESWDELFALW